MTEQEIAKRVAEEHKKLAGIMQDLNDALANMPDSNRVDWLENLRKHFFHFRAHMNHRVALEEYGGFMEWVVEARPTLARRVEGLRRERRNWLAGIEQSQQQLADATPDQAEQLESIRSKVLEVMGVIRRHTEEEDMVIADALLQDIGGES